MFGNKTIKEWITIESIKTISADVHSAATSRSGFGLSSSASSMVLIAQLEDGTREVVQVKENQVVGLKEGMQGYLTRKGKKFVQFSSEETK